MLRRSFSLLETGVVTNWRLGAKFGFIALQGQEGKTIFAHSSAIVQARNQRPVNSLRRGIQVQFDLGTDAEGRTIAKNITAADGKTLTNRDEIPSTSVDIKALRNRLTDAEDDSRHGQALRGIVQSISNITRAQKKTANMNRNIIRLLDAIAEKDGVSEILSDEAYLAAKAVVMANPMKESEERRSKFSKGKGEVDADDVDEDEDDIIEEASAKATKKEAAVADKKAEEFHSAEDLLDLMDESAEEKKPKGKKSKKN